jgi:putative ATP-dependent endonuclease of OLD family
LPLPPPPVKTEEDKFVQQVILANPEIYFARLVIIGEGDTERIVIPKMAEALETSLDPSFISYVSIGGRHAQHLWTLLNGLSIPHITLLDLDFGRYGGGMGRISNAVKWRTELGPQFVPKLVEQPATVPPKYVCAKVASLPRNSALHATTFEPWVRWLREYNIFYSSPLDLDMMMMKAFPKAYVTDNVFDSKADMKKLAKVVFGDSGKGNDELKAVGLGFTDEELFRYKELFKSSSKPGSHLEAFAKFTNAELKGGCPEPLKSLIERAVELISVKAAAGV